MEVYISKPITMSSLETLRQNERERRSKTYLISYKLSEYGTSECHRPLSQFGPNQNTNGNSKESLPVMMRILFSFSK
jgi:hypothetical protein